MIYKYIFVAAEGFELLPLKHLLKGGFIKVANFKFRFRLFQSLCNSHNTCTWDVNRAPACSILFKAVL